MMASPTPSKFVKWKRPLIGGLLSGLVATLSVWISDLLDPEHIYYILEMGFFTPALMVTGSSEIAGVAFSQSTHISFFTWLLTFALWFLIGVVIAYRVKGNVKAIGFWFVVLILLTPFFLVVLFVMYGPFWG